MNALTILNREFAADRLFETGCHPYQEIVISTRCRIARNRADTPFPHRLSDEQRNALAEESVDCFRESDFFRAGQVAEIASLDGRSRETYIEHRLLSPQMDFNRSGAFLMTSSDGCLSLLINEEDHYRVQVIFPGLQIGLAVKHAMRFTDELAQNMQLAWDKDYGYLTASPSNAGAGIRVSALVHLRGLASTGRLNDAIIAAQVVGCSVRGVYGEGSEAVAEIYQISNQWNSGIEEQEIIARVESAVGYMIAQERQARESILGSPIRRAALKADVLTALEQLVETDMSLAEAASLLSDYRWAAAEKIVAGDLSECDRLLAIVTTGMIMRNKKHHGIVALNENIQRETIRMWVQAMVSRIQGA
ncbi:MAG: hypothetical protein M1330_03805 [Armatimonadetes bacterium]|nr:hypothetical protein [Armatimonadota bacterium]